MFASCFQSFAHLAVPNVTICSQKASLYQLSHSIIIAMLMVLYYGRLCFVDGQRLELAHHNCDTRYLPCQLSDSVIRANGFCKYIVHRIQRRYQLIIVRPIHRHCRPCSWQFVGCNVTECMTDVRWLTTYKLSESHRNVCVVFLIISIDPVCAKISYIFDKSPSICNL